MSSSIRLTSSGAPETPPLGYARIFVEEYSGKLQLKMIRPDGSIEVFGTIGTPLEVEYGGTGLSDIPEIGEFLIGTGTGYRLGQIVAGAGVSIVKTETSFEISTDISNIELQMPAEFSVVEQSIDGQNVFIVDKAEQVKNSVYIAPVDADGVPTFRFLQVEDLPDLPISKIINLIETIRAESLLVPVDSADIEHDYDTSAKTLSSTIKPTSVEAGSYGSATQIPTFNVRADGRLDAVTDVNIAIPHTQITDFKEAVEDVVGELVENSTSINVEYDDYSNYLKFHVNEEHLITTNISATENQRAPTSQAIKQYVDDLVDAERTTRIAEDVELQTAITALETQVGENLQQALQDINTSIENEVNARIDADDAITQRLDAFFANAPELLDTITEIDTRFNEVELAITQGASAQAQALQVQVQRIDGELSSLGQDIENETDARLSNIETVLIAISTETNARVENDQITLNSAKAYTDLSISSLVGAAPDLLDTLKELSDALGGDANFATTIANQFTDLTTDISDEIAARQAADTGLSTRLNTIEGSGDGSLTKTLETANAYTDSQVLIETNRALLAEANIITSVNNYTDNKIALLVNSAPAVLDTLKELSDALGSDPNFATTIAGQISNLQTGINAEKTRAELSEAALGARLTNIEGSGDGSVIKALVDAKSYTDLKINDLIDGAPNLLNTLNELAAAIGDDQNFITTINTSISNVQTALTEEIDNRQTNDTQLNSLITSLQLNLATEQTNRINTDNILQNSINIIQAQLSSVSEERINELTNDLINESTARQAADEQINQRLNTFFANSSENLNTLAEIEERFEVLETGSSSTASQLDAFRTEINTKINVDLTNIQALIGIEADARVAEINRISNSISAKRELFELTPTMITGPIELVHVQSISKIMPNSVVAFIDRLGIFEGLDFNLQNTADNKVILTFTPEILTILDGTEVLRMTYLKKE